MDEKTTQTVQAWIAGHPAQAPWVLGTIALVASALVYVVARYLIARGLVYLAQRTENKYDDIVVARLRPFRFAGVAPLLIIYYFAHLLPEGTEFVQKVVLFAILWLVVITFNALLNAVNDIYEASHLYRGQSIQGYLDLVKIIMLIVALILSASLVTGRSPVVLLSGLGAVTAILLLVFHDTLLAFVASIQIQSNDLVKEGDWIEVPAYGADGAVTNISLHTVRIQNWDKTITIIPTYKLLDTPYKNWRGMEESGARRIKRAIHIDVHSISFCDEACVARFQEADLVKDVLDLQHTPETTAPSDGGLSAADLLNGRYVTNLSLFRTYMTRYLEARPDLHQAGMTMLVRQLPPGPAGLPLEVYAFTKTVDWIEYESIQADIFDHLMAALPQFDLRLFQQPSGGDFRSMLGSLQATDAQIQ
jgi:miniconductance mechanosensitive channel